MTLIGLPLRLIALVAALYAIVTAGPAHPTHSWLHHRVTHVATMTPTATPVPAPTATPTVALIASTVTPPTPSPSPSPALAPAPTATPAVATAAMQNRAFAPAQITVARGGTVTWANRDADAHTVTANDGSWSSGVLSVGDTHSHTFAVAGTYAYHCAFHSGMTGTVNVT